MTPYLRFVSKDGDKVLLNGSEFKLSGKSRLQPAHTRRQNSSYSIWKWPVAVGLAGVLLYFALRGMEWKRVGTIVAPASIAYSVGVS